MFYATFPVDCRIEDRIFVVNTVNLEDNIIELCFLVEVTYSSAALQSAPSE